MAVVATETETVVGSHVLTIDGYAKTMAALAVGERIRIQSEPFRVGGQSWQIVCCPRGVHEDLADWVSVSLWLYHHGGSHEVKASPRFVLLDRDGEEFHSGGSASAVPHTFWITTGGGGRSAWHLDEFVRREALEAHLIVRDDDCFRIRCDLTVVREPEESALELHRRNLSNLLLESEVGRDVTFVVGGGGEQRLFTAHSCVLAARSSPAFMEKVLGTGKEGGAVVVGGSCHVVRVDGVAPRVFEALLHFIYTDSLPDELAAADDDGIAVVQGLLAAADRYGMARLALACSSELLLASDAGRDVTFVVSGVGGGELLTAHMCVLAARSSPAFMEKVLGTGKESATAAAAASGGSRHVQVDGVTPRVFRALLHFIYTDTVVPDHGIARDLLAAADGYGMERLKMICSDILCSNMDAAMALATMKVAHRHGCVKLNKACVKFIRGMLDAFDLEDTK